MSQGGVSKEVVVRTTTGISSLTAEVLLKLLASKPNSNFFVSAFSLATALSMTAGGAKGSTLEEMMVALQFAKYSLKPDEVFAAFDQILLSLKAYQSSPTVHLSTANHLWIDKKLELKPSFTDLTKRCFYAGAESCDFLTSAEQERAKINAWAEKETNGKIKNLLPPNAVNASTALVLTNAIYFKASWVRAFDPNKTSEAVFTLLSGEEVKVPTMYEKSSVLYTQQDPFKAMEKPYKTPDGRTLSMVFVLPEENGLAGLEKTLQAMKPHRQNSPPFFLTQMFSTDLTVHIPKFKIEFEFEASELFQGLGMKQAFSGGDFSGISSHPLSISSIVHKAFVDVNEEGTEAAAATAVVMTRSLVRGYSFNANRPFIFLIWDRNSQLVLFSGLVLNPAH